MAENTNRSVFGFHGILGNLISVVGLLIILGILTMYAISAQSNAVKHPYDPSPIRDLNNLKAKSVDNKNFAFQEKDK